MFFLSIMVFLSYVVKLIRVTLLFIKISDFMGERRVLGNSKVGVRFQITIPKDVRDAFLFKEGDLVLFVEENGKLLLTKSLI